MPERSFLIFWIFLLFFSEFSCPGWVWTEFWTKIFFSLSRPIASRFGYKKWWKEVFEFFQIFCYFFQNFLARVENERNLRLKFFSIFFSLSHPVLAKNYAGKTFFNFLNFFAIFFGIFLPGSSINRIRD